MRVTENTNFDIIRDGIQRSKGRMEDLQYQSATLKKVNHPSDDPVGSSKILELRTDKVNNDQYNLNAKLAENFLTNTDHALADLSEIVMRAKEIAINQSSQASSNDDTRAGVAEEVTQLLQQALVTGNRRVGDRYLFGGFKTQKPPLDPEGRYMGDDGQMMVEIASEVFLSTNIPGSDAFNTQPKRGMGSQSTYSDLSQQNGSHYENENVNLFDELQGFRISLLTGDVESIRGTLERFDELHNKLIATRAKLGSRIQGLQSTQQAIERHNITNSTLASSLEDADMAQVVSDLGKEEMIFKSSLATSKRLIQPTLLEFLR